MVEHGLNGGSSLALPTRCPFAKDVLKDCAIENVIKLNVLDDNYGTNYPFLHLLQACDNCVAVSCPEVRYRARCKVVLVQNSVDFHPQSAFVRGESDPTRALWIQFQAYPPSILCALQRAQRPR